MVAEIKDNSSEVPKETEKSDASGVSETTSSKYSPKTGRNEDAKDVREEKIETTGDDKKVNEDALILSAEEEVVNLQDENCEESKPQVEESKKKSSPAEKSKKKIIKKSNKSVWVSNFSNSTKATDLKKLFSDFGVVGAKVVTNGRYFFGYITLASSEMARKSVQALNGVNLAGKKISVSFSRPDLKAARSSSVTKTVFKEKESEKEKEPVVVPEIEIKQEKEEVIIVPDNEDDDVKNKENVKEKNQNEKTAGQDNNAQSKKKTEKESKTLVQPKLSDRKLSDNKDKRKQLESKIDQLKRDVIYYRQRLDESNKMLDSERTKKVRLVRDMSRLESELKQERKRISQERHQMEQKQKMDEIRYEADRALLNKELDECKKLREYLEKKVDEVSRTYRSRSPLAVRSPLRRARSRSPLNKQRNERIRSPIKGNAHSQTNPRSKSHGMPPRDNQRTPPAPKLSRRSSPPPRIRSRDRTPPYKGGRNETWNNAGASKQPASHYQSSGPSGGTPWNSNQQPHYRYGPSNGFVHNNTAPPLSALQSTRLPTYGEFHKGLPGDPRRY